MNHRSTPFTTALRLAVGVLLVVPLAVLVQSASAKAEPTPTVTGPKVARQAPPADPNAKQPKISANATTAENQAVSLLNRYRRDYGAKPVPSSWLYWSYAKAHANYCQRNGDGANGCTRPYSSTSWENPSKPGYTAKGSQYAEYMLMVPTSSPSRAINLIMNDPGYRDGWLLDLSTKSVGIATVGGWTMVLVDWNTAPSGYPKTYPIGSNVPVAFRNFDLASGARNQWAQGCSGTTTYGFPISTQWDYTRYGKQTRATGTLYMDGARQWTCMVSNKTMLLNGQSAMIPMRPLSNGAIYTGSISGTFPIGGSSSTTTMTKPIAFTTWAAATGAPGDQSGDRVADFMGIYGSNLYFRKMRSNGTQGATLLISTRFNTSTWLGRAPDVNGDRRDDLMSRNTNGDIYIWYGNGMGSYTQGPKVGISWNSMNLIVPVGDMNGDGTPEMIARDNRGDLYRYTIFRDKITNKVKIGSGWSGQEWMVGIGKYTNDNRADIVSIDRSGALWLWPSTPSGTFSTKQKIGIGWGGYTYLFSPGDINRDGRPDLIARDRYGNLWTWFNNRNGLARVKAGSGWAGYRAFG